jgi:hypothetical protein
MSPEDTKRLKEAIKQAGEQLTVLSLYSCGWLAPTVAGGDADDQAYLAANLLIKASHSIYAELRGLEARLDHQHRGRRAASPKEAPSWTSSKSIDKS